MRKLAAVFKANAYGFRENQVICIRTGSVFGRHIAHASFSP